VVDAAAVADGATHFAASVEQSSEEILASKFFLLLNRYNWAIQGL